MEYNPMYERTEEGVGRAVARKRQPHDLHGVPTAVPDERRLPGLPQGALLPGRDAVPEVREAVALPSDQGPLGVLVSVLRAPRLPDSGHDFSQVEHVAPTV